MRFFLLSYINAGADMVETNSFGANRFKLQHYGLQDKVAAINEAAARLSREAAGDDNYVIASIGPTGKMLWMGVDKKRVQERALFKKSLTMKVV